jgi:gas vesicle protein
MSDYEFDDDEPYVVIEKQTGSIGSFLVGIAIGAGITLLLAPQAGEATRRTITTRARRARARAQDLTGDVADTVSDTFRQARDQVEGRIENARQAVEMKRQQVTRAMEAGREAAQQARAELERRIAETKAAYQAGGDVARSSRPAGEEGGGGGEGGAGI